MSELPPYAIIPTIGRILLAIAEHCDVGQTIKPGNRAIAKWINVNSVGEVPTALARLHTDGWIRYDASASAITLLRDPRPYADDPVLHPDEIPGYLLSLPRQKK